MLLLNHVRPGSKVLDVGCAIGYLGEYLATEKQCEVWGIESDRESFEVAQAKNYKHVLNKTIEDSLADPVLIGQQFDYVLLGDVLEHLVKPEQVLVLLKKFIHPDGRLLVSLPNVAHYSVRLALLCGKWNMADAGIMDRTHLHFYTMATAQKLFDQNGWQVESVRARGDLERLFGKIGLEKIGKMILFSMPTLFGVQFIFSVKPKL